VTDPGPPGQPYGDYQPQGGWPPPNPYGEQSPYGAPDPYGPYGAQPPQQYGQPPSYEQPQYQQPQHQQPQYQQPGYQASPYQPAPYGAPPPKKGGSGLLIGAVAGVVLLVLALCGVGVWALMRAGQNTSTATGTTPTVPTVTGGTTPGTARTTPGTTSTDPADATVGSCLAGDTLDSASAKPVNDVSIVDCSSSRAKYKVVGIVRNITESRFNTDDHICDPYPSAKSALWQGGSTTGKVLCLAPVK
jgi:hypothetical protein